MQRLPAWQRFGFLLVAYSLLDSELRAESPTKTAVVKPSAAPTGIAPVRPPLQATIPSSSSTQPRSSPQPRVFPAQNHFAPGAAPASVPDGARITNSLDTTSGQWIVSSRRNYNEVGTWRLTPALHYYFDRGGRNLAEVGEQTFTSAIDNGAPTCVVVFGSYNRWEDASAEVGPISRWLRSAAPDQPLNMVFFTWPSDGVAPFLFPVEIAVLGRRSSLQGVFLAEMLSHVPQNQALCLIGHSHGARTVASALHLMSGGEIENGVRLESAPGNLPTCRVVMMVAAMDHHWLNPGQRYGMALPRVERMLNVKNTLDNALGLYTIRKPRATFALGGPGLDWTDRAALGAEAAKIAEVDISRYTGAGHSWQDIYPHRDLALALRPYVFLLDDPAAAAPSLPTTSSFGQPTQAVTTPRSSSGPLLLSPTTTITPRIPAGPAASPTRNGPPIPRRLTAPRFPDW